MKNLIFSIFSTIIFFPLSVYANEIYSVEIKALTLVMEEYKNNNTKINDNNKVSPSYMAFKQDECNAKVEVTEKKGLQITTMESFDVNVCKKEINKIINN
tara:strand:- start:270 stop:569 length:300 start_codon:yes stop_codon:yes gene_type:complete